MSRQQRIAFAAIAAAIAVVAVIVLSGGPGDEAENVGTVSEPAATATAAGTAEPEAAETAEPTPEPTPQAVAIEVAGGKVKGGEAEIEVESGERVRFTVKSDAADHVHVHGYDVLRDVAAGQTARFDFKADIPGVFEVELEEAGLQVARLRVTQ